MTDSAAPADQRRPRVHDLYDEEIVEESRLVRPYAVTGGRTRASRTDLPIEALVRRVSGAAGAPGTPERRRILELTATQILSIAELSAHLSLPIGVVRVLVADLADDDLVLVHAGAPASTAAPASNLKLLESVLNGISAL